jgi:MoaA/NifB/PqqE/SkfB family radical SAM enzyme/glycosyltransferase involved in cell wall biosynthesis
MSRNLATFDVFLRTGFGGALPPAAAPAALPAAPHVYSLASAFHEVLEPIQGARGTYVVFADQVTRISEAALAAAQAELEAADDAVAWTPGSAAMRTLHGLTDAAAAEEPRYPLAPWFTIVKRAFLEETGLLNYKYQTLEFFLCEVSDRLCRSPRRVRVGAGVDDGVDYRTWARDVVLQGAARLASDYRIFEHAHRDHRPRFETPLQFRVGVSGHYWNAPRGLDEAEARNGTEASAPLFSVICPAYKSEFFADAMRSVMAQTWSDFELIVVVDGPAAEEQARIVAVLDQYATDPRVRFEVQENRGTGPTRRRLAELARGRVIVSIDDDDVFHPEVLKIFAGAIASHPEHAVFRAGAQLFGLQDAYLRPRQRAVVNGIPADLFEATQPFAIARSAVIELGGFDGDKSFGEAGEDSDLFLKIDRSALQTCLIDVPLYSRRLSTVNQTLSFSPDACGAHVRSLIERHRPDGWRCSDLHFERDGDFIAGAISYRDEATGREVVTATRFFDYQTLGDGSDVLIDLEITSLCNAVCTFCPREAMERHDRFISMELIRILADQLRRSARSRQVILCGIGESTLHPQLVDIVRTLTAAGAKVCMTTNGGLMNVDKFRALVEAGMREFNFSVNAATAETHRAVMKLKNFEKIRTNLRAILEYKGSHYPDVEVHASFVCCTGNQHEVEDFVNTWRDTPATQLWIHPVNGRAGLLGPDVTGVDMAPVQARFAGDERVLVDVFTHKTSEGDMCKIVKSLDFISVDGDMLLCALDYRRSVKLGNLRTTPLRELHLDKFLRYKRREINEICHGCDFCPGTGALASKPAEVWQ